MKGNKEMPTMKCVLSFAVYLIAIAPALISAAEPSAVAAEEPQVLELAEGRLQLPVPAKWKSVEPKSRIIQYEYSIPAAGDDKTPGRMTIMAASGGLEANITRWVGQFQTTEGKPLGDDDKKIEKKEIAGLEVHQVDLAGNYQDKPRGPFGPTVNRENYRMLAAIVPTAGQGTWFIKLYGPRETIGAAKKQFDAMIAGIVWRAE